MHSWAPHLFISLPLCSSDIHKRWVFGVKHPIRPLWMSKSPSRCTVLPVGQRLVLHYWSPHRQGASGFFNFYRVSSSTPQNNMLPHCPFIMSEVSEVCKVFFMWNLHTNQNCSRHWRCNIIVQYISAAMQCALLVAVGHAAKDLSYFIHESLYCGFFNIKMLMYHYNLLP